MSKTVLQLIAAGGAGFLLGWFLYKAKQEKDAAALAADE